MSGISRRAMAAIMAVSVLVPGAAYAADPLKEIRLDWATCNPVSMNLKQKGLLEKEFAKDGISVVGCNRPAPTRRSNSSTPALALDRIGKVHPNASTRWSAFPPI